MERNSPPTEPNSLTLRHNLITLLDSANSFQQSFFLYSNNIVDKLESFDNAIESRRAEIEKRDSLIDLRLVEVKKKVVELGSLDISLEAKLRDVKRREEECEKVDDRMRRTETERLNLERRIKEEEERIERMKRECEKRLEEFERLKLKENELENMRKEVELKELQCKKKLEEVERLKESANEGSKLKEIEVEKERKEVELKEVQVEKRLEELTRLEQSVSESAKKKENELEMKEKEMELKEMEFLKMLEEFERSKLAASEALKWEETKLEMQQKGMVMEFKKKLDDIERSKQIASEALKLKEAELEKQGKEMVLKEMEFLKMLEEFERSKVAALETLKLKEIEIETQQKGMVMELKKKLDEIERSKQIASEALKLKEAELEKLGKEMELKELEFRNKFEEHERSKLIDSEELKRKEKDLEKQLKGVELKEMELKKKMEELERSKHIAFEADDDGKSDVNDFQSLDPECSVFRLQIVWLEPSSVYEYELLWHDADLPVGCGKFKTFKCSRRHLLSMILHHIFFLRAHGDIYHIYPNKGETWAIFKDWNMKSLSESDKHKSSYQFQYVEIVSDFHPKNGVVVSYLGKVKGFVSTFQPAVVGGISFCIPPNELFRFSHRVPSHRLKGDERAGIPVRSFELDPAALAGDLFKSVDRADAKRKRNLYSKCPQSKVKTAEVEENHKPEIGASFITRKRQKNEFAADVLKPMGSPRDLSKSIGETEGSSPQAAKKLDNHGQTSATFSRSGLSKSTVSTVHTVVVEPYDFEIERSENKFDIFQVWAMFSDKDGLPRSYARIEKIVKTADFFRLRVGFLEPRYALKGARRSPCQGTFVKRGSTEMLPVTLFSHRLRVELIRKDEYIIYPGEGEIWALYRNNTPETSSSDDAGEFDIVEVLGVDKSCARVVFLKRFYVHSIDRYFYKVPKRSKPIVTNIPVFEFARFSHCCCAVQHKPQKDNRLKWFWEIDPKSLGGTV